MSEDDQPVAAEVLDRDFVADAPNQREVAGTWEFVNRSIGAGHTTLGPIRPAEFEGRRLTPAA